MHSVTRAMGQAGGLQKRFASPHDPFALRRSVAVWGLVVSGLRSRGSSHDLGHVSPPVVACVSPICEPLFKRGV